MRPRHCVNCPRSSRACARPLGFESGVGAEDSKHPSFSIPHSGRMNGRLLHRRSPSVTWLPCNCLVRAAQNLSLGSCWDQIFKSPTCGPSGVERRNIWPADIFQAFPLRGGMRKSCFLIKSFSVKALRRWYSSLGGCSGEEACVGKYAGAGGMEDDAMV